MVFFLFDDLNCVYPDCSLVYGFDRDTWQAVMNECKELYPTQSLSKKTKKIINKFAEAGTENFEKCDKIAEKLNTKDQIRESLRNIISTYSPESAKKTDKLESTFSISSVYPLMLPFFRETHLLTRIGTDGKASRKETKNNDKKGYVFPDLSMNYECGAMPVQRLLIAEIKPPHKVRTGSRPDFIKLAIQMKDSIDKMINDGVDDPEITVSGLLIEGFRCTLFVMDLKYQKIYRLIPLQVFYILGIAMILVFSHTASRHYAQWSGCFQTMPICASNSFETKRECLFAVVTSLNHAFQTYLKQYRPLKMISNHCNTEKNSMSRSTTTETKEIASSTKINATLV
ncbi:hypothetical protein BDC45DRAFT_323126 [Circinella umbellata]|nr:hypothetical protein BDC45DRAFT_323126 [Circinella umbellata]